MGQQGSQDTYYQVVERETWVKKEGETRGAPWKRRGGRWGEGGGVGGNFEYNIYS